MNALQRSQMHQRSANTPASLSLPGISPAQLRAMARELDKQEHSADSRCEPCRHQIVLEAAATDLESENDPLMLVYGGETCSTMNISPRIAAELLLLLERAG